MKITGAPQQKTRQKKQARQGDRAKNHPTGKKNTPVGQKYAASAANPVRVGRPSAAERGGKSNREHHEQPRRAERQRKQTPKATNATKLRTPQDHQKHESKFHGDRKHTILCIPELTRVIGDGSAVYWA